MSEPRIGRSVRVLPRLRDVHRRMLLAAAAASASSNSRHVLAYVPLTPSGAVNVPQSTDASTDHRTTDEASSGITMFVEQAAPLILM